MDQIIYSEKSLLNGGNIGLFGRRTIYVNESPENITSKNVVNVLEKIMPYHLKNSIECNYLYEYAKGKQPIMNREKQIRADINNKIVENHALEILTFKVGYAFGEPVAFVLHGDCDVHDPEKKNDERMSAFNELLRADNKNSKDKTLGNWIYTCGIGYRMCLPSKDGADHPFDSYVLDPRRTFVAVKDDYTEEPVLCGFHNRSRTQFDIFTKYKHWYIRYALDNNGVIDTTKPPVVEEKVNLYKLLPIVQYKANDQMQGCFEIVIDSCNALNTLESNGVDGIEQFIQSFIWFNNCDVDKEGLKELKDLGAISTKSSAGLQASIKILSETLDQQQTSVLKENIYQSMLTIAAVPDRRESTGGNTGQALILANGWIMAESAARDFENIYKQSEREFINIALTICKDASTKPEKLGDLALPDVDIHFTRRMTDNLLVKTQALMNMLQAGVHPRHAFKICGLFNDPEQAYLDSEPYLQKYINGEGSGAELLKKADNNSPIADDILAAMVKLEEKLNNGDETNAE